MRKIETVRISENTILVTNCDKAEDNGTYEKIERTDTIGYKGKRVLEGTDYFVYEETAVSRLQGLVKLYSDPTAKIAVKKSLEQHVFICECTSAKHQFIFILDPDDKWNECYLEISMTSYKNFWKRLWGGLRYAFGSKNNFGDFDSIIVKVEDAVKIRDIMQHFIQVREKHEAEV